MIIVDVFVTGEPKPAGSKRAFPLKGKGKGRTIIVDACKKSKDWKIDVQHSVAAEYQGPLVEGPLQVTFRFFRLRPKGHYGTGKNAGVLKASAPAYPTGRPDVLKLARAAEDALTGAVWRDDAQIVREHLTKDYGDVPGLRITVEIL